MKTKTIALIGLLLVLAATLGGCATGLTPSSWPGVTVDADNAYIAGGSFVYAVSLNTGAEIWRYPEKASTANPFYATPVLTSDGQLIVGGFDHKLTSLNPQTAQVNWQFSDARDRWIGGVLAVDGMIFAPNADYNLYALNLQGQKQWTFTADQSIWGSPVSDGTNIYFGTLGRHVFSVSMETGEQVWSQKLDGGVLGTPVLDNGTLYVGTFGGSLYTLSAADGTILKQEKTSSWIWSGPVLDGDALFVGDGGGKLYSFPLAADGLSWTQTLNGEIVGSPLVTGDSLVVSTDAGNVYFVSRSGEDVRPISVAGKLYSTPVAAGDLILVPIMVAKADETLLVALDQSGAVKWSFTPASK